VGGLQDTIFDIIALSASRNTDLPFRGVLLQVFGGYSDWLRAGWSGDRIPVTARFFASVHTGIAAHPTSYTIGTESLPGGKPPGRGVDHPPAFSAEVNEIV
jgi:hypothetical protein